MVIGSRETEFSAGHSPACHSARDRDRAESRRRVRRPRPRPARGATGQGGGSRGRLIGPTWQPGVDPDRPRDSALPKRRRRARTHRTDEGHGAPCQKSPLAWVHSGGPTTGLGGPAGPGQVSRLSDSAEPRSRRGRCCPAVHGDGSRRPGGRVVHASDEAPKSTISSQHTRIEDSPPQPAFARILIIFLASFANDLTSSGV